MKLRRFARPGLAGTLLLFGSGGGAAQQPASLPALGLIERGLWQLKEASGGVRKLCVTNPAALLQIRHGSAHCDRVVMENASRSGTVRYTCAGHGHGRTAITVETGKLVQIDTQGVVDGSPFSEQYEGRLLGPCS